MNKWLKITVITSLIMVAALHGFGQTYDYYQNPEKIGSKNPKATAYFIRAFDYIMQWGAEDADSAIVYLRLAIAEDSTYAMAYATMGHIMKYKGYEGATVDKDSMEILAQKAIRLNPRLGDAYTLMGRVYALKNDYRKAIDIVKKAVEVEPNHRETWLWLGVRYSDMPEFIDSAIYAFHKSLEVDKNFGQPHQKLGWVYLNEKEDYKLAAHHFRQMVRLYETALPRDERMILGYSGLAQSLIAAKNFDAAADTLQVLLHLCNTSRILWINNLRSDAYAGLTRCYLGKASIEMNRFIEQNKAVEALHPGDLGITQNALQKMDVLTHHVREFNFLDTLRKATQPLLSKIIENSSDFNLINSAIGSQIFGLEEEKNYQGALEVLTGLLKKFEAKKEIIAFIYLLMSSQNAQLNNVDQAIIQLNHAIDNGFTQLDWLTDKSFDNLRGNETFKKIADKRN